MTKFDAFHRTDLIYHTVANHDLSVSVLTTKAATEYNLKRPVLVFWHGGGFITGDRMYEPWWPIWLLEFAQSLNAMILCPDYRLLPEASGHDTLDDVQAFWTWFRNDLTAIAHSKSWIVQPDVQRTICAGQSSGAFIAVHSGLEYPEVQLKAILALYGPLYFDLPLLNMPRPRMVGGSRPPPPRQAEAKIREYIARTKGSTRTSGDPVADWELVISIVQQGWLPRLTKKKADARLDLLNVLEEKRIMPPLWVIQGEQDSVVPPECSTKFVARLKKIVPDVLALLSLQPGEHTFDASMGMDETWIADGCEFIRTYW